MAKKSRAVVPPGPNRRYDASNTKKCAGVFVRLTDGTPYLFGESAQWRWKSIKGRLALEVDECGDVALHAWADNVAAVGGPQYFFRDAEWK